MVIDSTNECIFGFIHIWYKYFDQLIWQKFRIAIIIKVLTIRFGLHYIKNSLFN